MEGILEGMLSGPMEHGGPPGSAVVMVVGIFVIATAVTMLLGSVLAILTTNVGFNRAFQLTGATFLGYMVMHSITWVMSGNGPRTSQTATDYLGQRLYGGIAGIVSAVGLGLWLYFMHRAEREAQLVPED